MGDVYEGIDELGVLLIMKRAHLRRIISDQSPGGRWRAGRADLGNRKSSSRHHRARRNAV